MRTISQIQRQMDMIKKKLEVVTRNGDEKSYWPLKGKLNKLQKELDEVKNQEWLGR